MTRVAARKISVNGAPVPALVQEEAQPTARLEPLPRAAEVGAEPSERPRRGVEHRLGVMASARSSEDRARLHLLRNAALPGAEGAPVRRLDAAPAGSDLAVASARAPLSASAAGPTVAASAEPGAAYLPHAQRAVDLVRDGQADDATRDALGAHFAGLSVAESKEAMDAIRAEGLLDDLLHATLRDEHGDPVDPRMHEAARQMMETGRLDAYAETLATSSFNVFTPGPDDIANPHFRPGTNGVYIPEAVADSPTLHETLTHETFHAFSHAHGSSISSIDEGFGIGVIHYAFTDDDYSLAEAVYGTKNFYRDYLSNGRFPLGDMSGADPKLRELLGDIAERDRSQLAWDDPDQLQWDYFKHWKDYSRSEDADGNGIPDWSQAGGHAELAEAAMLAGRDERRGLLDRFLFTVWKAFN